MSKTFGKYELIERIGKGGMAEVFLARSIGAEGLEKTLVIKKILPELATSDRFIEMFIGEAKIAMGLNHPNVVQIFDFGKVGSAYYLAMEHVDGVELARLLRASRQVNEPMAIGDAIYIAIEVARGLAYAHQRKDSFGQDLFLVHRDISPENLMLSWGGAAKIVDFGIASASSVTADEPGELRGKYRYMSPEQAMGDQVDHRSDLFSLGVVLFEMVCGQPLFRGDGAQETLSLVSSAVVPDLRTINSEIPESLERVMYKSLARDREERFESARAFQIELTRILYGLGDIHDATTVAGYMESVSEQLPEDTAELLISANDTSSGERETVSTRIDHTPRMSGTPIVGTEDEGWQLTTELGRKRKEVVVVAAKLTGLDEERDPQRRTDLAEEYRRIVDSIAYKYDGLVDEIEDSGLVVLLGIPVSEEDDAGRATHMAYDLLEAVGGLNLGFHSVLSVRLTVVIEDVILEEVAADKTRRYEWSLERDSQRRVRRILGRDQEADLVVDNKVYGRIRRSFVCTELDDTQRPRRCFSVEGPKSARAQIEEIRQADHPLYGREIVLRSLRDEFRQALLEKRGRALLLLGRTGVGKSTVLEEFLSGLSTTEIRVIRGISSPFDRDIPLASARVLFSEMMGIELDADESAIRDRVQAVVGTVFGDESRRERTFIETAFCQIFTGNSKLNESTEASVAEWRKRLVVVLSRLTNELARKRPLIIAVDDVHHVDPMMMKFAAQYFDRTQKAPVFFVGTGRLEGPHNDTRAWNKLVRARHLKVEELGDLNRAQAERMIRDLLADQGSDSDELLELVWERSGGNPLYIAEVVDALVDHDVFARLGDDQDGSLPADLLPASVEGLVRARIDQLDGEQREALCRLSFLSATFSVDEARAVLPGRAVALLDELVEEELLLRPDSDEGVYYRFANEITRQLAEKSLVPQEAAALHGQIADYLLAHREDHDSALIAGHLDGAGDAKRALALYEEAIEESFREFGADRCLRLCERVLGHRRLADDRRFRVLKWRETALAEVGETQNVRRETLAQLEELAPKVADGDEQIDVAIRIAQFHIDEGEFDAALEAAAQAQRLAEDEGDRLGMAEGWRIEATIELAQGRRDRALTLIDRAIASLNHGGEQRSREIMVETYNTRALILRQSGRHREALEAYETAIAGARGLESTTLLRQLLLNSGLALVYVGEFSEAKRRYQRALKACRRLGHRRDEAVVLINLGHVHQLLGRNEQAVKCIRRGIYLARRTENAKAVADGKIAVGLSYLEQGKLEKAGRYLEDGLESAQSIPDVYLAVCAKLGLVQLELRADDDRACQRATDLASETLEICRAAKMMWAVAISNQLLAQSLDRAGDLDGALKHSQRAVEILDEVDILGIDEILVTHAALLAKTGNDEERLQCIERVVAVFESRRDAIVEDRDRRAFVNRPINRNISALADELKQTS